MARRSMCGQLGKAFRELMVEMLERGFQDEINPVPTVNLPPQLAEMVETKVSSGEYASERDVIIESLQMLLQSDTQLDAWMADEVLATVQALDAGSEQTM